MDKKTFCKRVAIWVAVIAAALIAIIGLCCGKAVRKDRGDLYTTDEFYASDYITIPSGAESFYMTQQTYKGVIGWACYNSSKVFTHGGDSRKVTFQEGDVYFRVSINNDNLNSAMVVVGESASDLPAEYAPYGDFSGWRRNPISTDGLSDESVTLKKLNSSAVENIALIGQKQNYRSGGYVAAGNECVEYEGWNITDFIPFTGGGRLNGDSVHQQPWLAGKSRVW